MNQDAKILQGINNLITSLKPTASQTLKSNINDYCKKLFSSNYQLTSNQSAQQIKDKVLNKISTWGDNKTVLGCQQTINKIMLSPSIQKKAQILKVLYKVSEHNNKGKNFSKIFQQSKLQTLNQTQETMQNNSHMNRTSNSIFSKTNVQNKEEKIPSTKKSRGSLDQKYSQYQILTEITYSLQNIDSNIIKLDIETDSFTLQPNVNVNQAVRAIVNDLCQIGWLYKKVTSSINGKGTIQKSLFLAVQEELSQYFRWLAVIQTMIKQNQFNLTKLKMYSYEPLEKMRWLAIILESVQNYKGCQIISIINSFRPQGAKIINELLNRLLSHLVQPLLHFIHNWIYKGELIDEGKQFFVDQKYKVNELMEWYQKYSLVQKNIPNILDRDSAIMIFNAGKTTYFLKNRCKCNYSLQIPFINHSKILNKEIYESSNILSTEFKKWLTSVYEDLSLKLVNELRQKFNLKYHLESMKHFYLMGKGDFIQQLIDTLKDIMGTAKHLIYEHTLDGYINDALSKSFQDFRIDIKPQQIEAYLQKQKSRIQQGNQKMVMLNKSKISIKNKKQITYDNSYRANIIDRLLAKKVDFGENTAWDAFNFQYSLDKIQPLYSILTPELMKNYQKIFQFLWRIKRTEQVLKQIWMIQQKEYPKGSVDKNTNQFSGILHRCHTLRSNMSHFFNNFYGYLMIAIQSAWNKFFVSVQKAQILDEIIVQHQKLHEQLCKITFALPNKKSLLDTLTNVLKSIQSLKGFQIKLHVEYSNFIQQIRQYENRKKIMVRGILDIEDDELQMPHLDQTQLLIKFQQISNIYDINFRKFYQNLKREGQQSSVLVFRLDFSEFFAMQEIERKN